MPKIKDRWQRQEMDSSYESILHQMCALDQLVIETDGLEKGYLKDSYLRNNTEGSVLELIHETRDRMIYISVHIEKISLLQSPLFRDELRIFTDRLKKIYNRKK